MKLWFVAFIVVCCQQQVFGSWEYDQDHLEFHEKLLKISETIERSPSLKAEWNERVRRDRAVEIKPVAFTCDVSFGRSPERPASVHQVRPGDIDVIAAFGDSISAGNGLGANRPLQVALENRQEVYSIGGMGSLDEGITTLPNIIRKFNPSLKGYSVCQSTVDNVEKSWFNVAEPGGVCRDMPLEARKLIDRMKADARVDYENDWKLLTMFVGGNDLCASCRRNYSEEAYYAWFESALLMLRQEMPRTIVNLVTMFDITPLPLYAKGILCEYLQWHFCDCARNSTTVQALRSLQIGYDEQFKKLADDPRFKGEAFTVIRQPHLKNLVPPVDPETGEVIQDVIGPDCFHPSRVSHRAMAAHLWNTMLVPVGSKPESFDSNIVDIPISCPTEENPFIFTDGNST